MIALITYTLLGIALGLMVYLFIEIIGYFVTD